MPLPALATTNDLEDWLGSSVVDARAEAILAAASTLIRTHTGRLWVLEDDEPEEGISAVKLQAVQEVAVMVAARVYVNPHGRVSETVGPFSASTAAQWAALGLSLTDAEKTMIGEPGGGSVSGLGSVRVVAPAGVSALGTYPWWEEE